MVLLELAPALLLVVVAFGASTYLAALPLKREVARSVKRQEPLPRIAHWWKGVLARGWWLVGAAAVLVAGGAFAMGRGFENGFWGVLFGFGTLAYLLQSAYLVRVIDRTIERTAANG